MLSVVVHVAFAIATLFAIAYFSRLQKQIEFLRSCWRQVAIQQKSQGVKSQHANREDAASLLPALPKVTVDWPDVFLQKFADAFAIYCEMNIKKMPRAVAIDLAYIAGFHLRLNIDSIKLYEQSGKKICELKCAYNIVDLREAEDKFSNALGSDFEIKIIRKDGNQ
ncbi:MAG: hypothetical protein KBD78_10325 [Oligoflexales bacterium]|nr:hypothetical protein [Oligoflexales bacterium]